MKKLLLLIASCGILSANAQTTLVLRPNSLTGNDTFIFDDFPNTSYGTEDRLDITAWTQFGNPYVSRALIQFDLSSVPPGSVINSAYLSLFHNPTSLFYNGVHSGANAFVIQRTTTPWDQILATWNNPPSTTSVNQVYLPATVSGTQDYPNIDVTGMVTDMINSPGSGYGFLIRLINETYYKDLIFASSNHPDSTVRPMLVVNYLTTGLEEAENTSGIHVYPNPFSDQIKFETARNEESEVFLYDIASKKLMHQQFSGEIYLSTNHLAKGIYIYEVKDKSGVCRTGKVVKN